MVDLETIEREIQDLEARGDTTYSMCERLAWLYIVRDHLKPTRADERTTQELYGSEFLEAASGVPFVSLMNIINDHLEAIRVVYPKEYDSVLAKVRAL